MTDTVPYDFVLQYLHPVKPRVVKMLGGFALKIDQKMIMFLRNRNNHPEFNGVFIATHPAFFSELQKEIHTSRMEFDLDGSYDSWIFISEDLDDFDAKVKTACELVKNGDMRIGK